MGGRLIPPRHSTGSGAALKGLLPPPGRRSGRQRPQDGGVDSSVCAGATGKATQVCPFCRAPWLQLPATTRSPGACSAPKRVMGAAGRLHVQQGPQGWGPEDPKKYRVRSTNATGSSPARGWVCVPLASPLAGTGLGCALQASGSALPQWRGARAVSESGPSPALRSALWVSVPTWAHGWSSRGPGALWPGAQPTAALRDPHDLRPPKSRRERVNARRHVRRAWRAAV